jgi:hypothetical protein
MRVYYAPVINGVTYIINHHDSSNTLVCAFFLVRPQVGSTAYDGARIVQSSNSIKAPVDGYIAFRSAGTYTDESVQSENAVDPIARMDIAKANAGIVTNQGELASLRDTTLNNIYSMSFLDGSRILDDTNAVGVSVGAVTSAEIGSQIVMDTASDFRHYHVDVSEFEQYIITVRLKLRKYGIVFTDVNNIVVNVALQGATEQTVYSDVYVSVPSGAAKMWICANETSGPADWNANDKIYQYSLSVPVDSVNGVDEKINRVYAVKSADLQTGYINDQGGISANNKRFCCKTFVQVKRNDHIRCLDKRVQMGITEYANNQQTVLSTSGWYTGVYSSDANLHFGDYIVQNDGYVRITYAVKGALQDPVDLSSYDHVTDIIHLIDDLSVRYAYGRKWLTSKSGKPYKILSNTVSVYQQSVTYINGYLWVFCDNYSGTSFAEVYDLEGTLLNTISTDFGHVNASSYDAASDNLLFVYEGYNTGADDRKRLYIYHHPDRTAASMATTDSNCQVIYLSKPDGTTIIKNGSSAVWGENYQEIILADDYYMRSSDAEWPSPVFYKIRLGLGTNDLSDNGYGDYVSGKAETEYNGTCQIITTYTGDILAGVDTHIAYSNYPCVNDMIYDGYLYAAIDTSRANYVIFDLDDETGTYSVCGNYFNHYYDNNHSELHLEPEGITMNADGTKIYTGLRNTQTGISFVSVINRAL